MLKRLADRGLILVALASAISLAAEASAEDKLKEFMKAKLEHSEKILEGLAREDYDLIVKHSTAISLICEDELWSVLQTPEYQERSKEFRRSVYAITEAARKKNLEGAAFAYVESTMKCVSCHKYVRSTRSGK
jgi:cytochrome c556